ncbi:MAG: DUF1566 domain-containing protein [Moritella sp.]|uniref:Lcl C-terminal domain-containing protein n=1 Tax=Moritella sp. TaxID=78556 RepID=UPI0029AB55A8|nr:DUF1566 domain-containing protein [Moritella sp.]MDX2321197.1 DUF1566 domain-containing protein [Moritella sp.]
MHLKKLSFLTIFLLPLGLTGCGSDNLETLSNGSSDNSGSNTDNSNAGSDDNNSESSESSTDDNTYTATFDITPRVIQRGQTFTLNYPLDKPTPSALNYNFTITGTAVIGASEDYSMSNSSVLSFAAGSSNATLVITTYAKDDAYDARTLTLTFADSSGDEFSQPFLITGNVYLNDTGITDYSDGNDFNLGTQPGSALALQDAAYGLDVIINPSATLNAGGDTQDPSSRFYKNSRDVDTASQEYKGKAGFRFVKVADNGMPVTASSSSYSCVKDQVTGLLWQVKSTTNILTNSETDPELPAKYQMAQERRYNAANFSYPWEVSALSGAGPGWHNGSSNNNNDSFTTNTDPTGFANGICGYNSGYGDREFDLYCASGSYANETNFLKVCGKSNWVVPTVEQLRSIMNYEQVSDYSTIATDKHALDKTFFDCATEDCVINNNGENGSTYWTSSSVKDSEGLAWCVNLESGTVQTCNKQEYHKVLVVSSNVPSEFFNPVADDSNEAE